jgi:hypothetical protein
MRRILSQPASTWIKVLTCLAALDVLLFRVGWFWSVQPNFGPELEGQNWKLLYAVARRFEADPVLPWTAFVMGSSVVRLGVSEALINTTLQKEQLPVHAAAIFSLGASGTDIALLARKGERLRPWLIIYVAAARDFAKHGTERSPVIETFYDSSIDFPLASYASADRIIQAHVRRYWKLYRYRFFARTAVTTTAAGILSSPPRPAHAIAAVTPGPPALPPEALLQFHAQRVTPKSFAQWERWRQSRRFADYLDWIRANGSEQVINLYKTQTLANYGPDGNPHRLALQWMLESSRRARVRVVLVYAPENPVFRVPEAKPYFDESLSHAWAEVLADQARAYDARFVDLRDFLPPEDFYDLIHPNLAGMRKLSARTATIIEEEWTAWKHEEGR